MNNADVLAQIAHVGWMLALVSNAGWLFGPRVCLGSAAGFATYAVLKEWIYDANFETPKQTWKDNLLDMSMLWLGIGLGLAVFFHQRWLP
jgi:hypothetical protein